MKLNQPPGRPLLTSILAIAVFPVCFFWGCSSQQSATPDSPPTASIPQGKAAVGFMNMVNGKPLISTSPDGEVTVAGWAGCANADSPLASVDVLVDNQLKGHAVLGQPRPDVVRAYGRKDFARSGWTATFSAEDIAAGTHRLTANAVCTHGESGAMPPFQLSIGPAPGR
jgi:hypothetical protein